MDIFASLKRQDWWLNGALAVLAAASLVMMASTSERLFWVQFAWFALAAVIIGAIARFDIRPLFNYRWIIISLYVAGTLLLAGTLFFAPIIRHSRGWFAIDTAWFQIRFQPAELMKALLIILLAYFFARRHRGIAHVWTLTLSFLYLAVPALIIFLQPDWGSGMVLVALWTGFLLVSGIRWRHLAWGAFALALAAAASWLFLLAPYQKERIIGFFEPAYDPLGINYSVIQAKIAIGSGGMFGKGFAQGTQTQLRFLTEPSTDFIFAALVEEWGLVGGAVIVGAFFLLVFRVLQIGLASDDVFFQFICLGAAMLFLVEFAFNVGSNVGLLPVVGVTFPFFSYGGSSILTKAVLVGIIQSIATFRRA